MAINLLVTASAIVGFLNEAEAAQDDLNKAMKNCDNAAKNLLANWKGDAADAFAKEEESFRMWGTQMDGASRNVFGIIGKILDKMVGADTGSVF